MLALVALQEALVVSAKTMWTLCLFTGRPPSAVANRVIFSVVFWYLLGFVRLVAYLFFLVSILYMFHLCFYSHLRLSGLACI